jgi:hypothetical protein
MSTSSSSATDATNTKPTTSSAPSIEVADILVVPSIPLQRQISIKAPKNLSLILSICGKALKTYGDQEISTSKILILLHHILLAVSKLTQLDQEEQKQLALDSIHWLINNQNGLSDDEKQTLGLLSETVFPQAIELLSVAKTNCFSCLCKK